MTRASGPVPRWTVPPVARARLVDLGLQEQVGCPAKEGREVASRQRLEKQQRLDGRGVLVGHGGLVPALVEEPGAVPQSTQVVLHQVSLGGVEVALGGGIALAAEDARQQQQPHVHGCLVRRAALHGAELEARVPIASVGQLTAHHVLGCGDGPVEPPPLSRRLVEGHVAGDDALVTPVHHGPAVEEAGLPPVGDGTRVAPGPAHALQPAVETTNRGRYARAEISAGER